MAARKEAQTGDGTNITVHVKAEAFIENLDECRAWTLDFFVFDFLAKCPPTPGIDYLMRRFKFGMSINRADVFPAPVAAPDIPEAVVRDREAQWERVRADFYAQRGQPAPGLSYQLFQGASLHELLIDAEQNYWKPVYRTINERDYLFVGLSKSGERRLLGPALMSKLRSWMPWQNTLTEWRGDCPELDEALARQVAQRGLKLEERVNDRAVNDGADSEALLFSNVLVYPAADAPSKLRTLAGLGNGGRPAEYPYQRALNNCFIQLKGKEWPRRPDFLEAVLKEVERICGKQPDEQALVAWLGVHGAEILATL